MGRGEASAISATQSLAAGRRFDAPVSSKHRYRADIDGLRALAVLPVVLFHTKLGPFTGGFVGVDVFFVISGFLITELIVREVDAGRFSLRAFYERRVRRIFPALFAMLGACLIAGAFLFLAPDYRVLGRNVVGTTLFVSNIFFRAQTNYFDSPIEVKPLLHTWSLGVEEQFYIVFPLLVVWLLRWRRDLAPLALGVIASLSFLASAVMVNFDGPSAFYLAPFRFWELLVGALLALGAAPAISSHKGRQLAATFGTALIAFSAIAYSRLTPFPGVAALAPCVGAALIIHSGSGSQSALVSRVLASRPAAFVGVISYSLYLWHWPLFVFTGYYLIRQPTTLESLALVAVSFAVAIVSWHFIEKPFRRRRAGRRTQRFWTATALTTACAAVAGGSVYAAAGVPQRLPTDVDRIASYGLSLNPKSDRCGDVQLQLASNSPCTIGDQDRAQLFLWGDSHAAALYGALEEIARTGPATAYGATPRCPPLAGLGTSEECIEGNALRLEYVLHHPEIRTVILAARWSLYVSGRAVENGPAETNGNLPELRAASGKRFAQFTPEARVAFSGGLARLVEQLLAGGKNVVLVYPIPETGYDVPSTLARLANRGEDPANFTTPQTSYVDRQRFALSMLDGLGQPPGLQRIYPQQALCRAGRCLTDLDSEPLYFDSHHLSIPGARLLVPQLRAALAESPGSSAKGKRYGDTARHPTAG